MVQCLEYHMQVCLVPLKKATMNSKRVGQAEDLKRFQKRPDIAELEMPAETKPQLTLTANFRGQALTKSFWSSCITILSPLIAQLLFFMWLEKSMLKKTMRSNTKYKGPSGCLLLLPSRNSVTWQCVCWGEGWGDWWGPAVPERIHLLQKWGVYSAEPCCSKCSSQDGHCLRACRKAEPQAPLRPQNQNLQGICEHFGSFSSAQEPSLDSFATIQK